MVHQRINPLHTLAVASVYAMGLAGLLYVLGGAGLSAGQPWRWPELLAALLVSLLLHRGSERFGGAGPGLQRLAGVVLLPLLLKSLLGGGVSPFGGWQVFGQLQSYTFFEIIFSGSALAWCWRVGPRLPTTTPTSLGRFFRFTLLMTLALLLVVQLLAAGPFNLQANLAGLSAYMVSFVSAFLLTLAAHNVALKPTAGARASWLTRAILPALAILLPALLVAALLTDGGGAGLARLVDGVRSLLLWLLQPFAALLNLLSVGFLYLFPPAFDPELPPLPVSPSEGIEGWVPMVLDEAERRTASPVPFLLLLVIALLLLAGLVWLGLRWWRMVQRPLPGPEPESLWDWQVLGHDLRGMLGTLLPRRRQRHGLRVALAALHGHDPATRVRRAYLRLLLLAERCQRLRPPHHTAQEFQPQLEPLAPAASASLAQLTSAYEQARYGPPPHPDAATSAEAAWKAIERASREQREP